MCFPSPVYFSLIEMMVPPSTGSFAVGDVVEVHGFDWYHDVSTGIVVSGSSWITPFGQHTPLKDHYVVLVGTQKAMEETFGSTCHGAGRVLSRKAQA